jgi:hypothetical protein
MELSVVSIESIITQLQDYHIRFYIGNCDNGFHLDETLSVSLLVINVPNVSQH